MARPQLKSELESLKEDARQIMADISNLSSHVGSTTRDQVKGLTESLDERANTELEELRQRLKKLEHQSLEYAAKMDQHIKTYPYLYMLGAAGLAYVLGRFAFRSRHST